MGTTETTTIPDGEPTIRLGDRADGRVVLDRYRLDQRLGAGGFGVVWRAHDLKLERDVAVKVVPRTHSESERARTEREALAAARLNHPGIVALYEFGSDRDDIYLVSELVEGATLAELAADGAVSDRDVARIGLALCDALAHAHARGVIHRDVKPANVMVLAEPAAGAGFAKLTDLGIAHVASANDLTATGDVIGTIAYMAPEQAEGRRVTPAADVYSTALVLYEAWTGTNPVRGQSPAATARRVGLAMPSMRERRPDLPSELIEVIDAALDPDPVYRPEPAELHEVLAEVEGELGDEGGLVEPETLERFGLTAVRARTRIATLWHRGTEAAAPQPVNLISPPARSRTLITRGSAALGAAALVAYARLGLDSLAGTTPFPILAAAIACLFLPRLGWIATAVGLCAWVAAMGDPGVALLLAVAAAPVPILLFRAGHLWSVPMLAPVLGVVGLAPMFVGIAALGGTAWRRAGLAFSGFLWVSVAEVVGARTLLFGAADGTLDRAGWAGSAIDAGRDALWPLLSSGDLVPGLVWAAFAVVLPFVARGRWAALDLAIGALWAAGLVAAHSSLDGVLDGGTRFSDARGLVAGAVLGALVAVTAILLTPRRERRPSAPSTTLTSHR